jgi:hypothetical protein
MQSRDPFADVLERVQRAAGEEPESAPRRPIGASGFQVPFTVTTDAEVPATPDAVAGMYEGPGPEPARGPMLAMDPDGLACELGLAAASTPEELHRIRRRFALSNHPDRVAPALRAVATRRMMIANRLIDEALARLG